MKVRPDAAVEAKAVTLPIPGKGDVLGSIQKLVPGATGGFTPHDMGNLSPAQTKGLMQEQVVDWLLSNHDAHGKQFVQAGDKVYGVDKTQAFRYFPSDKLSTDYKPNTGKGNKG